MNSIRKPYLLFLGDAQDDLAAKTARGVAQWRPQDCIGQFRLPDCRTGAGLPDMTVEQARAAGAATMLVGIANRGGVIPTTWHPTLLAALAAGLDLAAGLHTRLTEVPAVAEAARRTGRAIHDVRHPDRAFAVGTGLPRSGRRLLTVGTDCSVGKMYASLAIEREMRARGLAADFRATGQTGIFIAGAGVSVDAVVADFMSGAIEELAPAAAPEHWDVIEGQGSLFHPSYAGVSLALLHGAQPEALVLCHEPNRPHMRGLPHQPLPDLAQCLEENLRAARLTSPRVRCIGLALNSSALPEAEAAAELERTARAFGLPCVDPLRTGVAALVDNLGP